MKSKKILIPKLDPNNSNTSCHASVDGEKSRKTLFSNEELKATNGCGEGINQCL